MPEGSGRLQCGAAHRLPVEGAAARGLRASTIESTRILLASNAWSAATTSSARGVFVVTLVPEPSTALLLAAGLLGLAVRGRRRPA